MRRRYQIVFSPQQHYDLVDWLFPKDHVYNWCRRRRIDFSLRLTCDETGGPISTVIEFCDREAAEEFQRRWCR